MKSVKMKTSYAGPLGTCAPGKEITLEDKEAKGLVDGGYAEYVETETPKKEGKGNGNKANNTPDTGTGDAGGDKTPPES